VTAPLFVIAPLALAPADAQHVDAIRRAHDPQHGLTPPHFTLVFGAKGAGVAEATAHVAMVATTTAPIAFRLDRALANDDYLFLMPAEGEAGLRALHRALHAGPFAGDLRTDMTFAPHVTVGVLKTPAQAAELAEIMGRRPLNIAGRLEHLDLVAFDGARVEAVGRFALSGSAPPD
jgi:2'-5' RNA ligase